MLDPTVFVKIYSNKHPKDYAMGHPHFGMKASLYWDDHLNHTIVA